jgi:hypothetical protein
MARLNKNAEEQNEEGLEVKILDHIPNVVITTNPVIICGVNRRVGLAHYEHIDIYAGVALPLNHTLLEDPEALRVALAEAAEYGFNAVSKETYDRYMLLVNAQKNKTEETPA